jgi:peroxiredoxin
VSDKLKWLAVPFLFLSLSVLAAGPEFSLKDLDGKAHKVSEYIGKGKWTVVTVWSADCPICKTEMIHMVFFHDEHKNKDATVLGVSIDGFDRRKDALAFIKDQGLNFPNLIASYHEVEQFGGGDFIGTPTYYIFSPEGKIRYARAGAHNQNQIEEILDQLRAKP